MRRIALLLVAIALAPSTLAAPTATLTSGGSIAQATAAFRAICMAHPGDPAAERAGALVARPRAFKVEAGSPPGMEVLTAWPVQLTLLDTPDGHVCAVLSPLVDAPAPAAALAEVRTRLRLGVGAAGDQHLWRAHGGTIGFAIRTQPDSDGTPRPTVQLTFTAAKAR